VPAPPGVDMLAPSEVPRNAEGRKVKAALVEDDPVPQYNAANNTSIIKAEAPYDRGKAKAAPES
jgi:hypothetical protein